jgi:hypothetical protein
LVSGQLQHIFLPDLPIFGPPSGGVGDGGGGLDDVNGHIYNPTNPVGKRFLCSQK